MVVLRASDVQRTLDAQRKAITVFDREDNKLVMAKGGRHNFVRLDDGYMAVQRLTWAVAGDLDYSKREKKIMKKILKRACEGP